MSIYLNLLFNSPFSIVALLDYHQLSSNYETLLMENFLKQSCEKYQDVNFCYDKYYEYDFIIMNLIEYGIDFGIFIDDNGNNSPYIYELLEDYIMDKCKIDYIDQYVNYHLTIIKKKPNFFIKKIKKLSKAIDYQDNLGSVALHYAVELNLDIEIDDEEIQEILNNSMP
ncbi:hypothetical protein H8356DRAFT_1339312 [Neocallimastix lanati (nom. inval.)]|nr:hypothetical protein H8356DRAFT_1339312 [Neocallimastix sp. JGI-2020a]